MPGKSIGKIDVGMVVFVTCAECEAEEDEPYATQEQATARFKLLGWERGPDNLWRCPQCAKERSDGEG